MRSILIIVLSCALGCAALALGPAASARVWSAAQVDDLLSEALRAPSEGLPFPASETSATEFLDHLANFDPTFEAPRNGAADALFRLLANNYAMGAVTPAAADDNWLIEPPQPPDYAALDAAVDAGAPPSTVLRNLLPQSPEYRALRDELARLMLSGARAPEHVLRLRANLERWRWLPRTWPARRIEVRIAAFKLHFLQEGQEPVTHDVIVGQPRTPTHAFSARIESVTLNPDWDPPDSIAYGELLPRFRRNPRAAAAEGFEAVNGAGQVVDAASVNWSARPFPYRIRQRPGPGSALGVIRFNLPNPYAIYLHDTPSRNLFNRGNRALSHGCVRVKDPLQLGEMLLGDPMWDLAALQTAVGAGITQDIALTNPVPVYFLYLTATIEQDGSIVYLNDIYRRDEVLARALDDGGAVQVTGEHRPSMCPA